jgi:hypothetical protein
MIWIASFPKSGNTWMRVLLSSVLDPAEASVDINDLPLSGALVTSRATIDDLSLVGSSLLTPEEVERLRPPVHDMFAAENAQRFFKTHDAFTLLPDGAPLLGRAGQGAIYLVRDPRDVAVSLTHFFAGDASVAMTLVNDEDACLGAGNRFHVQQRLLGWSGHAASWLDQRTLPVHVVRYEDLLADTARTFAAVLRFLEIDASGGRIAEAVRQAAFGELRRQEQDHGFREKPASARTFFREGRAGSWRDELTASAAAAIDARHGAMMARLGYDATLHPHR